MPRTFFRPRLTERRNAIPSNCQIPFSGNISANTTTTYKFGGFHRKAAASRFCISAATVPADADGTITAVVQKYDASAAAAVTLTAALDLEGLTADVSSAFTLLTTLTDDQRILDEGDTLRLVVTNNSAAIDTQWATPVLGAEVLVLE